MPTWLLYWVNVNEKLKRLSPTCVCKNNSQKMKDFSGTFWKEIFPSLYSQCVSKVKIMTVLKPAANLWRHKHVNKSWLLSLGSLFNLVCCQFKVLHVKTTFIFFFYQRIITNSDCNVYYIWVLCHCEKNINILRTTSSSRRAQKERC